MHVSWHVKNVEKTASADHSGRYIIAPCAMQQFWRYILLDALFISVSVQLLQNGTKQFTYHLTSSTANLKREGNSVSGSIDESSKGTMKMNESETVNGAPSMSQWGCG